MGPKARLRYVPAQSRHPLARSRYRGRRLALALVLSAGLGVFAGMLAVAPTPASGETGGAPAAGETSPTHTGTPTCPTSNPPNQMALVAGTPQTAMLQSAFAAGLQVVLSNSDGCAVTATAGVPVTFSAPTSGPSGVFSTSNSTTATVGADASGAVTAPTFTANDIAGSYTLTASSQYGTVSFSLTNTAAGMPASLTAIPLQRMSASVNGRYRQPLQVRVLDATGAPVAGVSITFTLGSASAGACGSSATASASFAGGGTTATATTNTSGLASSPLFTANSATGAFTATVTVSSDTGATAEGANRGGAANLTPASFSLLNLAGKPAKVAPGIGATQATLAGASFPIRLAVTVTDAQKNPVAGVPVTFSAPAAGASGRFQTDPHGSGHHRVRVLGTRVVTAETNACGIAVAPVFTADHRQGGYIVKASVKHSRPAAFALVNEAP